MKIHDQPNERVKWDEKSRALPWINSDVKGKNVRLTHLDGKLPNLALMKLSAWFKSLGANVFFTHSASRELFEPEYDLVLASSIFAWSENARIDFKRSFPDGILGGTGAEDSMTVEKFLGEQDIKPDYSIYPHFAPSLGFSQRGCRLNCSFCVVPKKEGKVYESGSINGIWRGEGHPKQIILLDNDFFGQPKWRERCQEIQDGNFEVSFNQGINIRLIHKEAAEFLSRLKYRDDQFKSKRIYTAWDNRKDEEIFIRGVKTMTDAGIRPQNIMVYFLCGYWPGETLQDCMYRFEKMLEMKLMPYPMVFDNKNKELKKFQRWVIRRYYQIIPWPEYDPQNIPEKENIEQLNIFPTL